MEYKQLSARATGHNHTRDTSTRSERHLRPVWLMGVVSGFAGITCCVSPWYWRYWVLPQRGSRLPGRYPVLHIRLVFSWGWPDSSHYRRGPLSSTARRMLNRRCVPVSLDVVRTGVLSSFDLRWPLLVHKVPWHLVRLALQDTAGTAGRGDGHRAGGGVPGGCCRFFRHD